MIDNGELLHYGRLGMHWGVRSESSGSRHDHLISHRQPAKQNAPESTKPKKKISVKDLSDQELTNIIRRMDNEKKYNDFIRAQSKNTGSAKAKDFVKSVLEKSGKEVASKVVTYALGKAINKMMHDTVISVGKDASKKKDDN